MICLSESQGILLNMDEMAIVLHLVNVFEQVEEQFKIAVTHTQINISIIYFLLLWVSQNGKQDKIAVIPLLASIKLNLSPNDY